MEYTTRTIVLSLLLGLLVIGAGCTGILDDGDKTRDIRLVNQDNTAHAVVVEISDDSGLVYSDGRTIDAETGLDLARFDQTGEFEVTVAVDGNVSTIQHTFEPDDDPVTITTIGIDNQGTASVE